MESTKILLVCIDKFRLKKVIDVSQSTRHHSRSAKTVLGGSKWRKLSTSDKLSTQPTDTDLNTWIGIIHPVLHKLKANTVLKKRWCNYYFIGQSKFQSRYSLPMQIFLSNRTNSQFKAQQHAVRKWLLLLSDSWTDRMLQYCWLITMICRPDCFISYQGPPV